jgi:aspartate aminotransferase
MRLSAKALALSGQPMFQVLDHARRLEKQGIDVIHLELGQPDFPTPEHISQAGTESIEAGETHYVSSWGIDDLRLASAGATQKSRGFLPELSQILVTPGANIAAYLSMACLMDQEDEVLLPNPGFPTYSASAKALGAKEVFYNLDESNDFRLSAAEIEKRVTKNTRLLIVNSPSNPTGAVTGERELRRIFDLAVERDFYIFSDEIYARMVYDRVPFFSISSLDHCLERVILSNGFSKAFSMTGWRLGIVIGPKELMEKMMLLLQTSLSCVPPFIQRAGVAALEGPQDEVRLMLQTYEERLMEAVTVINRIPGMSVSMPGGAFYLFPSIKETGLTSEEFCSRLLEEKGVAALPGTNFGDAGEGYIRIAAAIDKTRMIEGLERIRAFVTEETLDA